MLNNIDVLVATTLACYVLEIQPLNVHIVVLDITYINLLATRLAQMDTMESRF